MSPDDVDEPEDDAADRAIKLVEFVVAAFEPHKAAVLIVASVSEMDSPEAFAARLGELLTATTHAPGVH